MGFRIVISVTLALALGWFGWWFYASSAQERAIEAWLEERRAAGWQAEVGEIGVAGFPNRIDTTLTDLALADPAQGWSWAAPWLQIAQLSYDPQRAIVIFPQSQEVAVPGARATIQSESLRTSIAVEGAAMALNRSSLEASQIGVTAEAGWTAAVEAYQHHIRQSAPESGPENSYDFAISASRIRPPRFLRRAADPAGALPRFVETLVIEGKAAFAAPLDRSALELGRPAMEALSLRKVDAAWGELRLTARGTVRADASGYAEGEIEIDARNWEAMLDALVAARILPRALAETLESGLSLLARLSSDPTALSVPLNFSGGYMRLGPAPIGRAPRMR